MSVTVLSRVFWTELKDLAYQQGENTVTVSKPVAKLVMLAIADNADDFGENSWQSFETISKKASVERRSAIRAIKALMDAGYLSINGKSRYGTNDYKIDLSKLGHAPEARDRVGRPKTSDSGVTNNKKTSDYEAKTSDREAETSDTQSPDPSFNHQLNTTAAAFELKEKSARVYSHFSSNITLLTPVLADEIAVAIDKYPEEWIIEAINEAVKNSVRRWTYVSSILERWKVNGRQDKKKKNFKPAEPLPANDWRMQIKL